jgi:cystinosin
MDILLQEEKKNALYYISKILGWSYFIAWSISFYGQVIENYRRGKVKGLNFDFEIYNFVGFSSYLIYTIRGYIDENLGTGKVQPEDIGFAGHALLLTIITICQYFYYRDSEDKEQKVNHFTITILSVMIWGAFLLILLESILNYYDPHVKKGAKYVFNSLIYLGWCKVIISLIKYIPQVYSNYKRKSTIGWNIHNILLDFTGGILSFIQNIIDYENFSLNREGESGTLNIAKFAISFVAIFFDIVFMTQHYCLYSDSNSDLNQVSANYENVDKVSSVIENEN